MTQLKGQDASFIYVENESLKTHFTVLTVYDQSELEAPLRYQDILQYFGERIRGLPIFRCKLHHVPFELDAPYFVEDPRFHVEAHIRHIALPKPGDWRQFCILAAQIQALPIDMSKPLWDMHVVEGLDNIDGIPPGSFAILTRLHHAVADGTTARGILAALHHPKGRPPAPMEETPVGTAPGLLKMASRALTNNILQGARFQQRALRALPGVGPMLAKVAAAAIEKGLQRKEDEVHGREKVPDTVFNQGMEYRRVFQMRRYPLADIKRVRELVPGSTLNDAVLTLIGGAMRRYLAEIGERSDIDLVALCPINLRADKRTNDSHLGNDISLMQVNLGTRAVQPEDRLQRVFDATAAAKLKQKASTAKEIIALSKSAPNALIALGTRLAARAAFRKGGAVRLSNAIITNVPGPEDPLYFMGARLELFTGLGPVSPGSGLIFPVSSYCGQLCISFTGCPGWVEDPQALAECLDASYAELIAAADGRRALAAPAPRRKAAKKATTGRASPAKPKA